MLNVKTNHDAVHALKLAAELSEQIAVIVYDSRGCDADGALLSIRVLAKKAAELCAVGCEAFNNLIVKTPGAEDAEVSPDLQGRKL